MRRCSILLVRKMQCKPKMIKPFPILRLTNTKCRNQLPTGESLQRATHDYLWVKNGNHGAQ